MMKLPQWDVEESLRLLKGRLLVEATFDDEILERLYRLIEMTAPENLNERIREAFTQSRIFPEGNPGAKLARRAAFALEAYRDHLQRMEVMTYRGEMGWVTFESYQRRLNLEGFSLRI